MAAGGDVLGLSLLGGGSVPPSILAAVFALVLFVILFITKLMGYFKILLNIATFTYPNAFVSVKGNPCIQERALNRLIESGTIPEVLALVRGYGFAIDIGDYATMEEIDRCFEEYFRSECTEIEHMVPVSVQPFFRAFSMFQETEVLKAAFRLKHASVAAREMESLLGPVGIISQPLLQKMIDARNVDELVRLLQPTVYGPTLLSALGDAAMERTTLPFERALDTFACEHLRSSLAHSDALQTPPLMDFVAFYFDITNIKIALRGLRDGVEMDVLAQYFLPTGHHITRDVQKRMSEARSVHDMHGHLQHTPYFDAFNAALMAYEKSGSLQPIEAALDRALLDAVIRLSLVYHSGPATLLRYLVAKKFELQNVRAIVWGLQNRIAPETVRTLLIRQGGAA
ncbi:MAG: V-type ATPase subunit [Methanomicrobiaceae archaeon]|nr:V-type ATPase subunit [Methanomicrobiaceae archaeon]